MIKIKRKGNFVFFEVAILNELIQDCYSYSSMDAPSELKSLILEQVATNFDKFVMDNAPEHAGKDSLKSKLNSIEICRTLPHQVWKYKTEEFVLDINSETTLNDKLNEFGKEGWMVFLIEKEPNRGMQIGKFKMYTSDLYQVHLQKLVK
jgi:hypothetical protein